LSEINTAVRSIIKNWSSQTSVRRRLELNRRTFLAGSALALLLALPAWADDAHHKADALTGGEVRKVDKETKKITIKHGPIKNLDMPAMTMAFPVKDVALLEQVKAGDAVTFRAEQIGDAITLTRIEKAR